MRTLVVEVSPLLTLLVERRSIFSVSLILSCEVNQGNWSKTRGHAGSWRSVRIVSWLVLRLLLRTSKLEGKYHGRASTCDAMYVFALQILLKSENVVLSKNG